MFDIVFKRLIWKECRSQWNIWAALLGGAFLLQMLFLILGKDFQQSMVQYPFEVAIVLTACYALTCAAVLFAGETEEETDNWLRQLPLSAGQLFAGKLTFAVLSIVLFALISLGVGAVTKNLAPYAQRAATSHWWGDTIITIYGSIGLFLWGIFYSLILSRVMAVLAAAVVTQFLVAAVVGNFVRPAQIEYWWIGIGTCVFVADVWLTKQWLSGRSVVALPEGSRRFEGNRNTTDGRSRLWQRSLIRAANRTPLSMRTASVLVWRELRSAVPFAIIWGLIGVLMVDFMTRGVWGSGTDFLWLIATPILCGLMTCAGDNRRQTYRFLTDRGLNPLTVWLTKHAVWFSLALGLLVIFATYDNLTSSYDNQRANAGAWSVLKDVFGTLRTEDPNVYAFFADEIALRHLSLVTTLGLTLYLVGHVCSLWFRKVILALSVAAVAGVFLLGWHLMLAGFDISFALTTWPLLLAALAASLATVRGWMHEAAGWRTKLAKAAWVVIPVAASVFGALWYRANQIPLVDPGFDWQARVRQMNSTNVDWWSRWEVVRGNIDIQFSRHPDTIASKKLEWFLEDMGYEIPEDSPAVMEEMEDGASGMAGGDYGGEAYGMMAGEFTPYDPWENILTDPPTQATVEQLLSLAKDLETQTPSINPKIWFRQWPPANSWLATLGDVIVAAAHTQTADGDLDKAWQTLAAGQRLTLYLPTQILSQVDLTNCFDAREAILQEMHAWAAHPDQTIDRLEQAYTMMTKHGTFESVWPMFERQYAHYRNLIETGEIENYTPQVADWLRPFEDERLIRLASVIMAGRLDGSTRQAVSDRYGYEASTLPWVSPDITPLHIGRWKATTHWLPDVFGVGMAFDFRPVITTEAATRLILKLHLYRLEHGNFPTTLDEIGKPPDVRIHRDPYSGQKFGYAPDGFSRPTHILSAQQHMRQDDFILPTNAPLLWSSGGVNGDIVLAANGQHYMSTAGGRDLDKYPPRGRLSALVMDPDANRDDEYGNSNRILLVILGRRPW